MEILRAASFTALLELTQVPLLRCFVIAILAMDSEEHVLLYTVYRYCRILRKSLHDLIFKPSGPSACDMEAIGSEFAKNIGEDFTLVNLTLLWRRLFVSFGAVVDPDRF
jgi:hypothetical protein